jgi:hypothetical protein
MAKCGMNFFCCHLFLICFIIVIYNSSLVKGAMKAPRLCKVRNDVKKTPKILLFLMATGEPSAQ